MLAHLGDCAACCGFVAALVPDGDAATQPITIERYQLLEPLGAGAMGVVYAAYDPRLERRVAVKLLRTIGSEDDRVAASRRMWREACAMARLSHPNVVAVHDVGVVDDQVFIAMELVVGQMYELAFGASPFAGATVAERRATIVSGTIRLPATRDRTSARVLAVVRRGLAVDPAARYPSMRALLDELAPRRRGGRRRWWPIAAAALAAVTLVAASAAYHLGRAGSGSTVVVAPWRGPRPAIAVLGVRMPGAADDDRWLGPAVTELVGSGLAGDELRLVHGDDVARARAEGTLPVVGELPASGEARERPARCSASTCSWSARASAPAAWSASISASTTPPPARCAGRSSSRDPSPT
jgi:hypothetical protein